MSLFIGNVSKKVTNQEFEDAFKSYGNCKIDLRVPPPLPRKDTPSSSTTASGAHNKPSSPFKTPTSAACGSTSSGPKTQAGSTKTTDPKTTGSAESAATRESRPGRRSSAFSEGHPPTNARHPTTPKTRLRSTVLNPGAPGMLSKLLGT